MLITPLSRSFPTIQDLSHDATVNSAYLKDPLVKQSGSLRGINDMLTNVCHIFKFLIIITVLSIPQKGELLLTQGVRRWPKALPVSSARNLFRSRLSHCYR
jgi:acylglycerol lipase